MKLVDIFYIPKRKQAYSYQELFVLELKPIFVNHLSHQLGLNFDESASEVNVCLASSKELRPEYRITFDKIDIIAYIQALHSEDKILSKDTEVSFPDNSAAFWSVIQSA